MTGEQFLIWCKNHVWPLLLALSVFIQITPIKINPWSSLFKWIGNLLTGDIKTQITALTKQVQENEKDRIRWEILDFANSCRNGRKHTKDEFQHIVTLNQKYKALLKETGDENGVFEMEYEYIQHLYRERQEKNDFL